MEIQPTEGAVMDSGDADLVIQPTEGAVLDIGDADVEIQPTEVEVSAKTYVHCNVCTYKTWIPGNLRRHMVRHSKTYLFCPKCHNKFTTEALLEVHGKERHGEVDNSSVCSKCGKVFKTASGMTRHERAVHNPDGARYRCVICNKPFYDNGSYVGHVNTHAKSNPSTIHKWPQDCQIFCGMVQDTVCHSGCCV